MKMILTFATLLACACLGFAPQAAAQTNASLSGKLSVSIQQAEKELQQLKGLLSQLQSVERATRDTNLNLETQKRLANLENPLPPGGERALRPALQKNADYMFIVFSGVLVFWMQAGFCLVELGLARAKNSINVIMKNVLDFCVSSICYLLIGFSIMFGASAGGWIGSEKFWLSSFDGQSGLWVFWFYQSAFASAATTIASGAMAERTKFLGYLTYTAIFAALIYPIFGHWAWGSYGAGFEPGFGGGRGLLEALGFHDFAGSTVVHGIGGACALAGILVVGPRHDKFSAEGHARMISGHNLPLTALGVMVLWMGWFGFNAGSALTAGAPIGRICANTSLAGCAGGLAALAVFWKLRGTPDAGMALNGILGGAVAITAGSDCVTPASALVIGATAGLIATSGTLFLERLRLDDVASAVPVHLFNGLWGTVCVGLFHESGFRVERLAIQLVGTLGICGLVFIIAYVLFLAINFSVGLRATKEEQEDGLDFTEHSATAYPDFRTTER